MWVTWNRVARLIITTLLASGLLSACQAQPQPAAELSLQQRSAAPLPGWEEPVELVIDDISGVTVLTHVRAHGRSIAGPQQLRTGGQLRFEWHNQTYQVQLNRLDNALIGEDFAHFSVRVADPSQANAAAVDPVAEDISVRIEALLARLAAEPGAQLLRNGKAHPVAEGVTHVRRKWQQQRAAVLSVDDFIRLCATRSEQSGQAYRIRLGNGVEMELAQWLRSQ